MVTDRWKLIKHVTVVLVMASSSHVGRSRQSRVRVTGFYQRSIFLTQNSSLSLRSIRVGCTEYRFIKQDVHELRPFLTITCACQVRDVKNINYMHYELWVFVAKSSHIGLARWQDYDTFLIYYRLFFQITRALFEIFNVFLWKH